MNLGGRRVREDTRSTTRGRTERRGGGSGRGRGRGRVTRGPFCVTFGKIIILCRGGGGGKRG